MSARTVRAAIAAIVVASLNLLDERDLSAEQRAKADELYQLANSLEDTLEDEPAPATPLRARFNTGRKYTAEGQIIEAELVGCVVSFNDLSRRIDGHFEIESPEFVTTAAALENCVMRRYDDSDYRPGPARALTAAAAVQRPAIAGEAVEGKRQPTEEQLAALREWRDLHGRYWRSLLNNAWLVAGEGVLGYTPALQQLRNAFGPEWLFKVRL